MEENVGELAVGVFKRVFEGLSEREKYVILINAGGVEEAVEKARRIAREKGWKNAALVIENGSTYYVVRSWDDFLAYKGVLRGLDRFFGVYRPSVGESYRVILLFP